MRVLLIEDEQLTVDQIVGYLEAECQAVVKVARSRDSAIAALNGDDDFDLIVCDIRIPTQDGSLDVQEQHGLRVHDEAKTKHPGTFRRFFSGYARLDNVGRRLSEGASLDVLGTGEIQALVEVYPKEKQPEFLQWTRKLSRDLKELNTIDIIGTSPHLNEFEARTLRIYAKRLQGSLILTENLGGLSGATVLKARILDNSEAPVGLVVAKVHRRHRIEDELQRYQQYVAPLRPVGTFAPLADKILYGCGRFGAAFYTLAANGYSDLFKLSTTDISRALNAVLHLRDSYEKWSSQGTESPTTIGELRALYINDTQLAAWLKHLNADRIKSAERLDISLTENVQHGDLHGHNVLVDDRGRPLIIDYGNIGSHPAALDPVTLELSFVFHADRPELGEWPSVDHASHWFDLNRYTRNSPIRDIVRACREWASTAATEQQLAAVVYAHAMRQLKYDDTRKRIALAMADAALSQLLNE